MTPTPRPGEHYGAFIERAASVLASSVPDPQGCRAAADVAWLMADRATAFARGSDELVFHGRIGSEEDGLDSATVMLDLDSLALVPGATLTLRINSPGGFVFEGLAIYNLLAEARRERGITIVARIDGMAASMASVIAMVADRVVMPVNTQMLIHNPATLVFGDAEFLRSELHNLENLETALARIYVRKTGLDERDVRARMARETWMSGPEALADGFADEVEDEAAPMEAVAQYRATAPVALISFPKNSTGETAMADDDTSGAATASVAMPVQATPPPPTASAQQAAATAEGNSQTYEDGVGAERQRVASIVGADWTARYPGLQRQALAEGWSLERLALEAHREAPPPTNASAEGASDPAADRRKAIAAARQADAEAHVPPAAVVPEPKATSLDHLPPVDRAKAEWEKDPAIREEFGSTEAYAAYLSAKANGQVRHLTRNEEAR